MKPPPPDTTSRTRWNSKANEWNVWDKQRMTWTRYDGTEWVPAPMTVGRNTRRIALGIAGTLMVVIFVGYFGYIQLVLSGDIRP